MTGGYAPLNINVKPKKKKKNGTKSGTKEDVSSHGDDKDADKL